MSGEKGLFASERSSIHTHVAFGSGLVTQGA